uniref:U1-C C2H2-type zinc finger domain-containing protein n=1 Tax=Aegilops tauschii subsp. strangulata TaxID=200361 RepID=A0A453NVH4_AEGTS
MSIMVQPSVRKQHNAGYKHKANVRNYYQQFEEQQTQSLIDQRIKEHLGQAAAFQVGAPFNQHLLQYPGNMPRPRLPILPTPMMQHGYPQHQQPGGPFARPPILPVPGTPGKLHGSEEQNQLDTAVVINVILVLQPCRSTGALLVQCLCRWHLSQGLRHYNLQHLGPQVHPCPTTHHLQVLHRCINQINHQLQAQLLALHPWPQRPLHRLHSPMHNRMKATT